jgi:hypothetical protein
MNNSITAKIAKIADAPCSVIAGSLSKFGRREGHRSGRVPLCDVGSFLHNPRFVQNRTTLSLLSRREISEPSAKSSPHDAD